MKLRTLLLYFLSWQVLTIFVVTWSKNMLPLQTTFIGGGEQASFSDPKPYIRNPELYFRGNFDGIHYINIARRGIGLYEEAFFPLYPKIIGLILPVIKNSVLAGSLISGAAFFLGLFFLTKLISLDHDKNVAFWSIISILLFPVSFYYSSVYTEGLFFLLAVSSFYFARCKRWWISALLVAFATYTRLVGIFLIPALLLEYISQNKHFRLSKILPFLIMPLGLLIYMNYLHKTKGDALAFVHVQKNFGQGRSEKIILLYQVIYRYGKMLTSVSPQNPLYITLAFEAFISLAFISLAVILVFKSRPSYAIYSLCALILPTLTGTFTSMPRYVLICFPVFILIGKVLNTSKTVRIFYLFLNLLLFVIFLTLFSRGYWVA